MRTAIIISGNLRTWLMPTREDPNSRLADTFVRNLLNTNNADVFIYTDTNDFYHNGTQYYSTNREVEILNDNSFRLHDKIDFISPNEARGIIREQVDKLIGNRLKDIVIEDLYDPKTDPKFELLNNKDIVSASPTLLIHQFRKLKLAYELVKLHESIHKFSYDLIVKWRFDITSPTPVNFASYDYKNNDVYVAGLHVPTVYDWHTFGTRAAMDSCLRLYDYLGSFLPEGRIFVCNNCRHYGTEQVCGCGTGPYYEMTLSPEYHLFKILNNNKLRFRNSGYHGIPYRYKDIHVKTTVAEVMKNNGIEATLVNYTPGVDVSRFVYNEGKK